MGESIETGPKRPLIVRAATLDDLQRLTEIYNHYILTSPATFDLVVQSIEQRRAWLQQHDQNGPYRVYVAEEEGKVMGYASSSAFRSKRAYDTTIETSIYCAPAATGRSIGTLLYEALFESLRGQDLHVAIAAITLPNAASVRLHERFGFEAAGVMRAVGREFGSYWDVAHFQKRL
jgi:phosphinothricin acetyltransferase